MLSQTAEYALQATVLLAESDPAGPVRVSQLADALGAPRNYLSKILGKLVRGGVLTSLRGPAGGFRLAVEMEDLTLSRIVGLFDPPPGRSCVLGRPQCSDESPCAAHPLWKSVADHVDSFFRRTTIAELLVASRRSSVEVVHPAGSPEAGKEARHG